MIDKYEHAVNSNKEILTAVKEKAKAEFASALKTVFKEFFEAHREITAIAWTQYTPYWNDGEPCHFRVYSMSYLMRKDIDFKTITLESDFEAEKYHEDNETDGVTNPLVAPERKKQLTEAFWSFEHSVRQFSEMFEWTFGESSFVIATPDGFHISEYEQSY